MGTVTVSVTLASSVVFSIAVTVGIYLSYEASWNLQAYQRMYNWLFLF